MTDLETTARARWRSAEDRLYPTLIADVGGYRRALTEISAIVGVLRDRGDHISVLLAADADPDALVGEACSPGPGLPAELMVGVACGIRDRELAAERERRRVEQILAEARVRGDAWAALSGPEQPDGLAENQSVALHLPSGTVVTATVDSWSADPRYELQVTPPQGEQVSYCFTDRTEWLDAQRRCRAELDDAHLAAARTGTP
jgi:hypothetical protein